MSLQRTWFGSQNAEGAACATACRLVREARTIAVVGTSGSGKTCFSRRLAKVIGKPHLELDDFLRDPSGEVAGRDAYRQRTAEAIRGAGWITDGGGPAVRDLVWPAADLIIWLDYPSAVVLSRLLRRGGDKLRQQASPDLGSDARKSKGPALARLLRILATRSNRLLNIYRHRREYPILLAAPEHAHAGVLRLRCPQLAEKLLRALESASPSGKSEAA